jgi:hypothetical protein
VIEIAHRPSHRLLLFAIEHGTRCPSRSVLPPCSSAHSHIPRTEVTAELTQILSNLVLGDNEIRTRYLRPSLSFKPHHSLHFTVLKMPSMIVLLAPPSCISSPSPSLPYQPILRWSVPAPSSVFPAPSSLYYQMRSFSLVLLRRLLFRPAPAQQQQNPGAQAPRLSLYDHLSSSALSTVERLLLHSLSHEPSAVVRRKSVDTITDLANNSMQRGRPWHALQAQAFSMTQSADAGLRESAFRVFAGSSMLVMDLQTDAVLRVLKGGLEDSQSIDVSPHFYRSSV